MSQPFRRVLLDSGHSAGGAAELTYRYDQLYEGYSNWATTYSGAGDTVEIPDRRVTLRWAVSYTFTEHWMDLYGETWDETWAGEIALYGSEQRGDEAPEAFGWSDFSVDDSGLAGASSAVGLVFGAPVPQDYAQWTACAQQLADTGYGLKMGDQSSRAAETLAGDAERVGVWSLSVDAGQKVQLLADTTEGLLTGLSLYLVRPDGCLAGVLEKGRDCTTGGPCPAIDFTADVGGVWRVGVGFDAGTTDALQYEVGAALDRAPASLSLDADDVPLRNAPLRTTWETAATGTWVF